MAATHRRGHTGRTHNPFSHDEGRRLHYKSDPRYGPQMTKFPASRRPLQIAAAVACLFLLVFMSTWSDESPSPTDNASKLTLKTELKPETPKPTVVESGHEFGYKPKLKGNQEERPPYHQPEEGEKQMDHKNNEEEKNSEESQLGIDSLDDADEGSEKDGLDDNGDEVDDEDQDEDGDGDGRDEENSDGDGGDEENSDGDGGDEENSVVDGGDEDNSEVEYRTGDEPRSVVAEPQHTAFANLESLASIGENVTTAEPTNTSGIDSGSATSAEVTGDKQEADESESEAFEAVVVRTPENELDLPNVSNLTVDNAEGPPSVNPGSVTGDAHELFRNDSKPMSMLINMDQVIDEHANHSILVGLNDSDLSLPQFLDSENETNPLVWHDVLDNETIADDAKSEENSIKEEMKFAGENSVNPLEKITVDGVIPSNETLDSEELPLTEVSSTIEYNMSVADENLEEIGSQIITPELNMTAEGDIQSNDTVSSGHHDGSLVVGSKPDAETEGVILGNKTHSSNETAMQVDANVMEGVNSSISLHELNFSSIEGNASIVDSSGEGDGRQSTLAKHHQEAIGDSHANETALIDETTAEGDADGSEGLNSSNSSLEHFSSLEGNTSMVDRRGEADGSQGVPVVHHQETKVDSLANETSSIDESAKEDESENSTGIEGFLSLSSRHEDNLISSDGNLSMVGNNNNNGEVVVAESHEESEIARLVNETVASDEKVLQEQNENSSGNEGEDSEHFGTTIEYNTSSIGFVSSEVNNSVSSEGGKSDETSLQDVEARLGQSEITGMNNTHNSTLESRYSTLTLEELGATTSVDIRRDMANDLENVQANNDSANIEIVSEDVQTSNQTGLNDSDALVVSLGRNTNPDENTTSTDLDNSTAFAMDNANQMSSRKNLENDEAASDRSQNIEIDSKTRVLEPEAILEAVLLNGTQSAAHETDTADDESEAQKENVRTANSEIESAQELAPGVTDSTTEGTKSRVAGRGNLRGAKSDDPASEKS